MKNIIIAVIITAIIAVLITYFCLPREKAVDDSLIVKFNCEQSGGNFSDGACICVAEDQYEKSTGYCITTFGDPGGKLGETSRKLQELKMLESK